MEKYLLNGYENKSVELDLMELLDDTTFEDAFECEWLRNINDFTFFNAPNNWEASDFRKFANSISFIYPDTEIIIHHRDGSMSKSISEDYDKWIDEQKLINSLNNKGSRYIVEGATGSGKTYYAIKELTRDKRFIYIAPCRQLVYESYIKYGKKES